MASLGPVDVALLEGGCVGVQATRAGGCLDVVWGVMTRLAGVGGHNMYEARAYVALPLLP